MRTIDYTQLLKIAGQVEGILAAAVGKIQTEQIARAEAWGIAACQFGLATSGTRADAVAMRRLVTAGLLESAGQTQGRSYRLTVQGWFTASSWLGCAPEALRVLLRQVSTLQSASKIILPGDKRQTLCMTWNLIPEAGQWMKKASRNAAAWKTFCDAAAIVEGHLCPLIALGLLTRFVSTTGAFCALMVTDAGKAALNDWPTFETPQDMPGADHDATYQAWTDGYAKGKALARTSPPDSVKNVVTRLLPATSWM